MNYTRTILKNGLRLVTVPMPKNQTVTMTVMANVGARYESLELSGISHFLEHMCFKGTKNRTAKQIAFELDSLGADSNAFTGQEATGYYAKAHFSHLPKIAEILSDIYLNSTFPPEEIEKERGVIIEEINMYEDMPQSKVSDVFAATFYQDHPMGRSIAGPKENIKRFTQADFIKYHHTHYSAAATTIVVAGNVKPAQVKKLVEKYFAVLIKKPLIKPEPVAVQQSAPLSTIAFKDTDQSHLVLGFRTFDMYNKKRPILSVLSAVLGSGMSSRLFSKMREELGICYYIRSGISLSTDSGALVIRSGVGHGRLAEAINGILSEIKKLKEEKVPADELEKVRNMFVSDVVMGLETSNQNAEFYGEQELFREKIREPQEMIAAIKKVTPAQIQALAKEIFQDKNIVFAVIGPNKNEDEIKKLLTV